MPKEFPQATQAKDNPIFTYGPEHKLLYIAPALYRITEEQFTQIVAGGTVEVEHRERTLDEKSVIQEEKITKRIYGGP